MTPCYLALDCIVNGAGELQVTDVRGGVGGGMAMLAAAYGGRVQARARLRPYLQKLAEIAGGRRVLFMHDSFTGGITFPDDFFNLVQRYAAFGPVTDWVPDLQNHRGRPGGPDQAPDVAEMGVFLDPLAARLRVQLGYCDAARIDSQTGRPMLLLSGYRERARRRPNSVVLPLEEVGAVVYSGVSERFPEELREQDHFAVVNPPLLDELLENKWLLPMLLEGTPAAALLPRSLPVGMGLRTGEELREFIGGLQAPRGFPLAVMKPGHTALSPHVRFLDRPALRALAARQPDRRIPAPLAESLLAPRVSHSYDEVSGYRGKLLDNLLRTPGAEVHDHGDGTFHYSAPYPFLRSTVALLQEYVDARPVRSRRTGKLHRGSLRVVLFGGTMVAAIHRLDSEPDEGVFRDLSRPGAPVFYEAAEPAEEAALQERLAPFAAEIQRQLAARVHYRSDLDALFRQWVHRHAD